MIDLRNKAREISRNNPRHKTIKCVNCACMEVIFGRIWCNAIGDYKTKDYQCPKEYDELLVKSCELYCMLRKKGITNIEFVVDGDVALITGFGFTDVLTKNNIDIHLKEQDEYYKKWYSYWVEYFNEELNDNKRDNGGR